MQKTNPMYPQCLNDLIFLYPNYVRFASDFTKESRIHKSTFGIIWSGIDKKYKEKVIIHEIKPNKKDFSIRYYLRYIYLMMNIRHPCLGSMIGFTTQEDLLVVMSYEPYSLSQFLWESEEQPSFLQGINKETFFTQQLLCIASLMETLHSKNILLRNLTLKRINVSDNGLPVFLDLGIARLESNGNMTKKIGDERYMAPEVMKTDSYKCETDVYQFGLLMYEISERKVPFYDHGKGQLIEAISSGGSSLKFHRTSNEMKKFILKCTKSDPSKRPKFSEIYKSILSGKLKFEGSNLDYIKKLDEDLKKAIKEEENENKEIPKQYNSNQNHKLNNLDEEILLDPNSELFCNYVDKIINNLSPQIINKFINIMIKNIQKHDIPDDLLNFIILSLLKKSKESDEFASECFQNGLLTVFPLKTQKMKDYAIDFLSVLFSNHQDLVCSSTTKELITYMTKYDPKSMLMFLQKFMDNFPLNEKSFQFILIYVDNYSEYLNTKYSNDFIITIYSAIENIPDFSSYSLKDIVHAISNFLNDKNKTTVVSTLNFLSQKYSKSLKLDFDILFSVAKEQDLLDSVLSLLIRIEKYPPSEKFAKLLINMSCQSEKGFLALLRFVDSDYSNAYIVAKETKWMETPFKNIHDNFRLLCLLYSIIELRQMILHSPSFPDLLNLYITAKDDYILSLIPTILRRGLDEQAVENLKNKSFISNYFNYFNNINDQKMLYTAILAFDSINRVKYCSCVTLFIPKIKAMFSTNPELTETLISSLVTMSFWPQCCEYLNQIFGDYFRSLLNYQKFRDHGIVFLDNYNKINHLQNGNSKNRCLRENNSLANIFEDKPLNTNFYNKEEKSSDETNNSIFDNKESSLDNTNSTSENENSSLDNTNSASENEKSYSDNTNSTSDNEKSYSDNTDSTSDDEESSSKSTSNSTSDGEESSSRSNNNSSSDTYEYEETSYSTKSSY